MMLLAMDAGDTNIVFAVCDGKRSATNGGLPQARPELPDEYAVWLAELLKLHELQFSDLTDAVIGTVVPAVLFDLRHLCRQYLKCEPLIIGEPNVDPGIGINTDRPHAVGADRLANAVAAHQLYPGDLIVVDFGTATNFDVVECRRQLRRWCHCARRKPVCGSAASGGGVAAPRRHTSCESVIGKDTVPAMQSGLYWGYVGLIEGLVARIKAEHGTPMRVIATANSLTSLKETFRRSNRSMAI